MGGHNAGFSCWIDDRESWEADWRSGNDQYQILGDCDGSDSSCRAGNESGSGVDKNDTRRATKIIAVAGAIALVVAAIGALTSNYVMLGVAMAVASIAGLGISSIVSSANSRSGSSRPNTASAYQNANRAVSYASAPFRMPRLATGTVVPPRAGEFTAVLGDNKRETEVVSPLSTMKQALKEALEESGAIGGGRDIHIDLILNGQRFASAVYKANNQERQRVGVRMVQQNA